MYYSLDEAFWREQGHFKTKKILKLFEDLGWLGGGAGMKFPW